MQHQTAAEWLAASAALAPLAAAYNVAVDENHLAAIECELVERLFALEDVFPSSPVGEMAAEMLAMIQGG